jgi:hypothetical protein
MRVIHVAKTDVNSLEFETVFLWYACGNLSIPQRNFTVKILISASEKKSVENHRDGECLLQGWDVLTKRRAVVKC